MLLQIGNVDRNFRLLSFRPPKKTVFETEPRKISVTSDVNSPCIFEEVTREFLRGSRANAWENMAEDALRKEWEVFGFERLNKHQEEALQLVVESKSDVFVNLSTGFGEFVVFQALSIQGHLTTVFCKISTSTFIN